MSKMNCFWVVVFQQIQYCVFAVSFQCFHMTEHDSRSPPVRLCEFEKKKKQDEKIKVIL